MSTPSHTAQLDVCRVQFAAVTDRVSEAKGAAEEVGKEVAILRKMLFNGDDPDDEGILHRIDKRLDRMERSFPQIKPWWWLLIGGAIGLGGNRAIAFLERVAHIIPS